MSQQAFVDPDPPEPAVFGPSTRVDAQLTEQEMFPSRGCLLQGPVGAFLHITLCRQASPLTFVKPVVRVWEVVCFLLLLFVMRSEREIARAREPGVIVSSAHAQAFFWVVPWAAEWSFRVAKMVYSSPGVFQEAGSHALEICLFCAHRLSSTDRGQLAATSRLVDFQMI